MIPRCKPLMQMITYSTGIKSILTSNEGGGTDESNDMSRRAWNTLVTTANKIKY
jgi:hypothetical protein